MLNVDHIVSYVNALRGSQADLSNLEGLPKGFEITPFSQVKMVSKPWGFEMWLAHDQKLPYALKMIYIKAGTKTSLQYHQQKIEHNVVFAGSVRLHYEDEQTKQIMSRDLAPGCVIAVSPPTIHRVEALTDVFLVEVSTNHLDDVVRLSDDYKRRDGKIDAEHMS